MWHAYKSLKFRADAFGYCALILSLRQARSFANCSEINPRYLITPFSLMRMRTGLNPKFAQNSLVTHQFS